MVARIRSLESGFAKFSVDPVVTPLPGTCGIIPTPSGLIEMTWDGTEPPYKHPPTIRPAR